MSYALVPALRQGPLQGVGAFGADTPAEIDALFHITGSAHEAAFLRLVYPRCGGESCQGYSDTVGWWASVVWAYASLTLAERNGAWKQLESNMNIMALAPLRSRLRFNISIDAEAPKAGATEAQRKAVADKAVSLVLAATADKKLAYAKLIAAQAKDAAAAAARPGATAEDKLIAKQLARYASDAMHDAGVLKDVVRPPVDKPVPVATAGMSTGAMVAIGVGAVVALGVAAVVVVRKRMRR